MVAVFETHLSPSDDFEDEAEAADPLFSGDEINKLRTR